MKINILGTTLQAAVFAGVLAEYGHQVAWCLDQQENKADFEFHYQDNNVNQLIQKQLQGQNLRITHFDEMNFEGSVVLLSYASSEFERAKVITQQLPQQLQSQLLIINGSTFGLNSTEQLMRLYPSALWAYLPDNIQEGNALNSVTQMQKIIVGVVDQKSQALIQELLRPLFPAKHQYLFMPILDAEFTKLSISGMLATRISYMNDLAQVSEKLGIDILNVQQGLASDSRIGGAYLSAGAGFGGENFSQDILTLSSTVSGTGAKSRLLEQVWNINEEQKEVLFRKLWNHFQGDLKAKVIAIWGAAFKENTSSIKNSPIHNMLAALWAQGAIVQLHDPEALGEIEKQYGQRADLVLCTDPYQAAEKADALCVLTAWKTYWSPDFQRLQNSMNHAYVLDGRNIYNSEYTQAQGFTYQGVGRGS